MKIEEKKKFQSHVLEQGHSIELAAPFRVSKHRGFCLYSSVRQEAARVLPRLPLKTQGSRDRS